MTMSSRERMLRALENKRPDRLPAQVHGWMQCYLDHHLGGIDQWQAYENFGMDFAIYNRVKHIFAEESLANWKIEIRDLGMDHSGGRKFSETITTPKGELHTIKVTNEITEYETEHLIKSKKDFDIFNEFYPAPIAIDASDVIADKAKLGDKGILRTFGIAHNYGQTSPWQSLCYLMGTEPTIMAAIDDSSWMHYALESLLNKSNNLTKLCENVPTDLIENWRRRSVKHSNQPKDV